MAEDEKPVLTADENKMMLHVGARWIADGHPEGWVLGSWPPEATAIIERLVEKRLLVRASQDGNLFRIAADGREWIQKNRAEIRTQA